MASSKGEAWGFPSSPKPGYNKSQKLRGLNGYFDIDQQELEKEKPKKL